ncbi:MAG: LytTR family transcriptional regulator [Gracilibacteraceae bacterium]|jgi:DNA-binding LytR/AlgR family response regulator|nr:LytTR family transcriptional regulator [Gracilibacteraceae bacterium]
MVEDLRLYVRRMMRDESVAATLRESPKLRRLVKRLYDEVRRADGDDGSVFPVKNGAETKLFRASDIFFFEAQGRKIALRTKAQEILFYSNFDQLLRQLPDWFLRCHRGYIVNIKKIDGVNFADNVITMTEGSAVPISRTYRDSVRERLEELKVKTVKEA